MKKEIILKNKTLKIILRILTTLAIIAILFFFVKELISNVDSITKLSKSAGVFGPIVLIILISLGILFTPIPSVVLIVTAGYLYGPWLGALYSYLGHMLAAVGTFGIVKKLKMKEENKRYKKYKIMIEKNKNLLYLLYAVPIIPISIVSVISASLKIKWKDFMKINIISFIPAVIIFSFFGDRVNNKNLIEIIIWVVILSLGAFITYRIIKNKQKKNFKKEI